MLLLPIVITLIVVGILLWLEEAYLPVAQPVKTIIRVVVVVVTVIWLLQVVGLWGYLGNVSIK